MTTLPSMCFRSLAILLIVVLASSAAPGVDLIAPARNVEPALGDALAAPLIIYTRDSVEPCFADYVPTPAEVAARPTVRLATNEYEPLQLGLFVPSRAAALEGVTIEVRCDVPLEIGSLYYEPRARRRVLDFGRVYDHRRPYMPLYVLPGTSIPELRPGRSAAFWVTFGDRGGVPAGEYTAKITIRAESMEPVVREFRVQVRDFALPRPRAAFGCYYRIDRVPVYYGRRYQELYVRDQAEHGHNCAQIISYFSSFGLDAYHEAGGQVPVPEWIVKWRELMEPTAFDRGVMDPKQFLAAQMEMFREAGLVHPDIPVFGVQDNPTGPRKAFVAKTLRELSATGGWPEILLYTRDEPPAWTGPGFSEEWVDHLAEYKRLRQARSVTALGGESAVAWGHLHDVWIVLGGYPTPEMVREAARQKARVWTYLHDLRITNAVANRYYAGLYTWGLDLAGNVPYAYHHGEVGKPHPVYLSGERRPSREQIMGFILPGPDGPIPGVGWEGRREGIDDYRYLQLLETRVSAAADENLVAREAKRWLTQLRAQIVRAAVRGVFLDFVTLWDLDWLNPDPEVAPSHYATIREVAVGFIERLPAAPGEGNAPPASYEVPLSAGLEGVEYVGASLAECETLLKMGTLPQKRAVACALALRDEDALRGFPATVLGGLLEDPDVRVPALRALRAMGAGALDVLPAVEAQLRARDPFLRLHALLTLDALGDSAIEPVTGALKDDFPGVVGVAAHILRRRGRAAAAAVPTLETTFESPNPCVRRAALDALRAIRGD